MVYKKLTPNDPYNSVFYLLGGLCELCINHVYYAIEGYYWHKWLGNCTELNIKPVHNPFLQSTNWPENTSQKVKLNFNGGPLSSTFWFEAI